MSNEQFIGPFGYAMSLLFMGCVMIIFSTVVWTKLVDWPTINAKLERLEELELKADVYESMTEFNIGVWCELAVHYEWLEPEDRKYAQVIIDSGVHE